MPCSQGDVTSLRFQRGARSCQHVLCLYTCSHAFFHKDEWKVYIYLLNFLFCCFVLGVQKAVWCLALLLQASLEVRFPSRGFCKLTSPHHKPITECSGLLGTSRTPCHGQGHFHYCRSPVPSLPPAQGVVAAPITQQFQSSLMLMSLVRRDPFGIIYIETVFLHPKWKMLKLQWMGFELQPYHMWLSFIHAIY